MSKLIPSAKLNEKLERLEKARRDNYHFNYPDASTTDPEGDEYISILEQIIDVLEAKLKL